MCSRFFFFFVNKKKKEKVREIKRDPERNIRKEYNRYRYYKTMTIIINEKKKNYNIRRRRQQQQLNAWFQNTTFSYRFCLSSVLFFPLLIMFVFLLFPVVVVLLYVVLCLSRIYNISDNKHAFETSFLTFSIRIIQIFFFLSFLLFFVFPAFCLVWQNKETKQRGGAGADLKKKSDQHD